jgi:hypothetical protein
LLSTMPPSHCLQTRGLCAAACTAAHLCMPSVRPQRLGCSGAGLTPDPPSAFVLLTSRNCSVLNHVRVGIFSSVLMTALLAVVMAHHPGLDVDDYEGRRRQTCVSACASCAPWHNRACHWMCACLDWTQHPEQVPPGERRVAQPTQASHTHSCLRPQPRCKVAGIHPGSACKQ